MTRVLVVEHDAQCPPAWFGTWLEELGCELDVCRPYAGDALPVATSYGGLVVLGGPMGADDDATHHWIGPVKQLLRGAHATGLPTLGICLGHQLIAAALGGAVTRNPRGQQVGLLDLGWTDAAGADALFGPLATPRRGVQWNDDIVAELPPGATLLAETAHGEAQVVRYGARMWGVQLHPEVDDAVLQPWADEDKGSHETRGIDTDALLDAVRVARAELDEAWRPLAVGFVEQLR
ncbi:type 1 glutamine amidotransferase [Nocardioides sp. MAH-18]|uniref:Type 1 glutamine amidotransferase n=1 Tax=Nocardioides agri TaxID=2682843 RepID=A0A6L6XN42_9ACTN|nr:type 1 glutamine amidotransferase [Nocardioides sp. CGMCC 1.13656]MBA2953285.1 type 1 glutamine amidotransferase [Nocardioides sp. CGMCC 1.13656]MVQ48153.1 type 1 glutamine amidotransferase [Nocardioides sp. MAH-18]